MPAELRIHRLSPVTAKDSTVVHHLTELINTVYHEAESALWQEAVARTDPDEVAASIAAGQIIVARRIGGGDADDGGANVGEGADGPIVGVVQAHATNGRGWFGMLAVDLRHRGEGVGRRLVRAAEELTADAGAAEIEISVIMTTNESFAPKIELAQWYQRLGYDLAETVSVAQSVPGLEELLAVPCHMQILRKALSST